MYVRSAFPDERGAVTATDSGDVGPGGNCVRSAVSTTFAVEPSGSTLASTPVNSMRRNGRPAAISTADVTSATVPGRRITRRDKR